MVSYERLRRLQSDYAGIVNQNQLLHQRVVGINQEAEVALNQAKANPGRRDLQNKVATLLRESSRLTTTIRRNNQRLISMERDIKQEQARIINAEAKQTQQMQRQQMKMFTGKARRGW